MKHLKFGGVLWCDEERVRDVTEDPREAGCLECLKRAASYGAAAAMRYAAVEAGATRDPELSRERDDALKQLNEINRAIVRQGGFFCTSCRCIRALNERGIVANDVMWCAVCMPGSRVPS